MWVAAIGALPVLAAVVPGAGASAAAKPAKPANSTLAYACGFPSGAQQIGVRVTGAFPAAGVVDKGIQPVKVSVTVSLPQAALGDVTELGATTVTAALRLTTLVTRPGASTDTDWSGLTAPAATISQDGVLVLTASGQVPAVTVKEAGPTVFSAAELAIELTLRKADGSAPAPATMSLTCTPNLGQNTVMATVPVSEPKGLPGKSATAESTIRALAAQDEALCPPPPPADENGNGFNPKFPLPAGPPGTQFFDVPPQLACALVNGYSNVNKLSSAAPVIGNASVAVGAKLGFIFDDNNNYFQLASYAEPHLDATRSTFLTFGFMPTSAKMEIKSIGNMNVVAEGPFVDPSQSLPTISTATAEVSLRIFGVTVNGVPLDVGRHCQIAQPMKLVLTGNDHANPPYLINLGGELKGTVTIPPFKGCGVGENLDPLFTAAVSGPGNFIRLRQGPICDPLNPNNPASPCPMQNFGWTVTPGGPWNATAGPVELVHGSGSLTCGSGTVGGTLTSGVNYRGVAIGAVTGFGLDGCNGTGSLDGSFTGTFIENGLTSFDAETYDAKTGTTKGQIDNLVVDMEGPSCSLFLQGGVGFTYVNSTHTLTIHPEGANTQLAAQNIVGCGDLIFPGDPMNLSASFVLSEPQKFTSP